MVEGGSSMLAFMVYRVVRAAVQGFRCVVPGRHHRIDGMRLFGDARCWQVDTLPRHACGGCETRDQWSWS